MLFIYPGFSIFVTKDYQILTNHFQIKNFCYKTSKKLTVNLQSQIKMFIWLLKNIWLAKFIYIWFADYHSFLPVLFGKIFKKKSILVLGGYDVTYIPEIKYGSFSNPLRAFCAKYSMKNASICLPVSYYVEKEAKKRIKGFNSKVIYNGIDIVSIDDIDDINEKENIAITVGICDNLQRIKLKGIDLFVETAKLLPDYKFIAIGISKKAEKYLGKIPENVQLIDKLPYEKLSDFYKKAKIYCQFSMVESFGLAVLEAISFGAIPIISNKGALPEIFGDCSIVVDTNKFDEEIKTLKKRIDNFSINKDKIKKVVNKYDIRNRYNALAKILL